MTTGPIFDKNLSLQYLGLSNDFIPSPDLHPIEFLSRYLTQLPPHLLLHYSYITTPKQRSVVTAIRNRRWQYANKKPPELSFEAGRSTWPNLWQGRERRGVEEGAEEKSWAQNNFLQGNRQHIGKLGDLLAEYEEEREVIRVRELRGEKVPIKDEFVPEEDSDDDDDDVPLAPPETETLEQARASFERLLHENFIYGLLDDIDYDKVDWDDTLDVEDDREAEERWFDED